MRWRKLVIIILLTARMGSLSQAAEDVCLLQNLTDDCLFENLNTTTLIYPQNTTRCFWGGADGDDANPYYFRVRPGQTNNVILFFKGGGFCAEIEPCLRENPPAVLSPRNRVASGIFDIEEERNPFQNWTSIAILYCSGDGHVGGNVTTSIDNRTVAFAGRENVRFVLQWLYHNLPSPDKLVLTGCSAGAMGLMYWAKPVLLHYESLIEERRPEVTVLMDGWSGLQRGLNEAAVELWGLCSGVMNDFRGSMEDYRACLRGDFPVEVAQRTTHAEFSETPFVFVNYKDDFVQRVYYCRPNEDPCTQAEHYRQQQLFLEGYVPDGNGSSNVLFYWLDGTGHCVLDKKELHDNHEDLVEWLRHLVERSPAVEPNSTFETTSIHSVCEQKIVDTRFGYDFGCSSDLATHFDFILPTNQPEQSLEPTMFPTNTLTETTIDQRTHLPTTTPTTSTSTLPSPRPTVSLSAAPTFLPTQLPSDRPTHSSTAVPIPANFSPTQVPTERPTPTTSAPADTQSPSTGLLPIGRETPAPRSLVPEPTSTPSTGSSKISTIPIQTLSVVPSGSPTAVSTNHPSGMTTLNQLEPSGTGGDLEDATSVPTMSGSYSPNSESSVKAAFRSYHCFLLWVLLVPLIS